MNERIVIGIEGLEQSRAAKGVRCLQVKVKKSALMALSGLMLMDVQERCFQEGDQERKVRQDANVTPHGIYTYTAKWGR